MNRLQIYTAEQLAPMLGCSVKTVEEKARLGLLPGLLLGDGGWVFPAGALALRLDQLAIEQSAERRRPRPPSATTIPAQASKPKRGPLALPRLVDVGLQQRLGKLQQQ